jgi:hypothetical protein
MGARPIVDAPARARPRHGWSALLGGAAVLVALVALARLAEVSAYQLAAPFDLNYETPILRTIELLRAGRDVYDPAVYDGPPYWISVYTPLFHTLVAALPPDADNPFLNGRIVGLCCMLLAASTLLLVAGRAWAFGLLTLGAYLLLPPVVAHAAFLKVDTLALSCAALGVLACAGAARRPRLLPLASVLCALALFSKQSFVAAALACVLQLAVVDRRRALLFACMTAALTALLVATVWSPGFRFSILEGARAPMTWIQVRSVWREMSTQPVFLALLALAGAGLLAFLRRPSWRRLVSTPYPAYACCSTAVLLATLPKQGSASIYFLEPMLAFLLLLVAWARGSRTSPSPSGDSRAPRFAPLAAWVLVGAAVAQVGKDAPDALGYASREANLRTETILREVAQTMRSHGPAEPRLLNLYSSRLSYPVPGLIELSDPLTYMLLWHTGRLRTDAIVDAVRAGEYDGVVVLSALLTADLPQPVAGVLHAVQEHYRVVLTRGPLTYLVPSDAPP